MSDDGNSNISASMSEGLRTNPSGKSRKIRGVSEDKYVKLMHQVERGEISEGSLVRKKILLPGRGIAANRDDKIFNIRSKVRGRNRSDLCRVPWCNNTPSRRGLCNTHRTYYKRLLKIGKANEKNLINRGLLLPKQSGSVTIPRATSSRKNNQNKSVPIRRSNASLVGKYCLYPCCKQLRKTRGLCKRHYTIYLRQAAKLSTNKKCDLEKDLVRRHLLLPENKQTEASAFELGSKIKGIIRRS